MHKVISTALLLAAGTALANAASVYSDITKTESESLVAAWNFNSGTSATDGAAKDTWTWGGSFGHTDGSVYATFGGNNEANKPKVNGSDSVGFNANAFTISFDVKDLTAAYTGSDATFAALLTLYTTGSALSTGTDAGSLNLTTSSLQVWLNPSDNSLHLQAYNGFGGATISDASGLASASTEIRSTDWTTVTVVSNGESITLYLDGKEAGSLDISTSATAVNAIKFGGMLGRDQTTNTKYNHAIADGDIDNLAIWNTALTAEQVAALPEPSSFGLLAGLGALALVAARRRRSRKA